MYTLQAKMCIFFIDNVLSQTLAHTKANIVICRIQSP